MKNGVETVVVTENGREVSRRVGGVEQLTDGKTAFKTKNIRYK